MGPEELSESVGGGVTEAFELGVLGYQVTMDAA